MRKHTQQDGLTLLITLLLMGVLIGVTTSLINVTLKQYQFSGISYDSEVAFQAANAGMECMQFHDWSTTTPRFNVGAGRVPITCFDVVSSDQAGAARIASGSEQRFQFTWSGSKDEVCTDVSLYKFYNATTPQNLMIRGEDIRPGQPCPAGSECTYIESRGYNVACEAIDDSPRVVEREYSVLY